MDARPMEKEDPAAGAVGWCSLLGVQSLYHLVPTAGAWLWWGLVCVLRCNELDLERWVVLVEYGNVEVQFGRNGIHEGWGGLQIIYATEYRVGGRLRCGRVGWRWAACGPIYLHSRPGVKNT